MIEEQGVCERWEGEVLDLAEDRLAAERREAVEAHVHACARCRSILATATELAAWTADAPTESAPDAIWDRIAAGLTLGHLLECSGQGSGGNFGSSGEWARVPDYANFGYPIAEVSADGSALLTKPPGTGGRVSFDTVRQQLLYEVHNPHAYYSPDVVLDMGTLKFDDEGNDRVRISGASGAARPRAWRSILF